MQSYALYKSSTVQRTITAGAITGVWVRRSYSVGLLPCDHISREDVLCTPHSVVRVIYNQYIISGTAVGILRIRARSLCHQVDETIRCRKCLVLFDHKRNVGQDGNRWAPTRPVRRRDIWGRYTPLPRTLLSLTATEAMLSVSFVRRNGVFGDCCIPTPPLTPIKTRPASSNATEVTIDEFEPKLKGSSNFDQDAPP